MNSKIVIRIETDADASAIAEVTVAAFQTLAISHHTESFIIAALRAAQALTVSLVAEMEGRVIGHIAFSRDPFGWHAELVRPWTGFGVAGVPAARRWQSPDPGRAVTAERDEGSRLLSRGASGLLPAIRVQKNIPGLVHEGCHRRLLRTVFRRAYAAGRRRFPRRIQSGWPTRGCRRRFTARLTPRRVCRA